MTIKVGELFAGAGIGALGWEWAGFKHAWFVEKDERARKRLEKRWPGVPVYEDVRHVDFTKLEPVDVIASGFPCQDVSKANPVAKGITGEKSGLYRHHIRAISEVRPRYSFAENSSALINRGIERVLCDYAALRHDAEWDCVKANLFAARQLRERIWIVSYPHSLGRNKKPVLQPGRLLQDEIRKHTQAHEERGQFKFGFSGNAWWETEPGVDRVVDGSPDEVDRLELLGNGQCPFITHFYGRLIQEHAAQ